MFLPGGLFSLALVLVLVVLVVVLILALVLILVITLVLVTVLIVVHNQLLLSLYGTLPILSLPCHSYTSFSVFTA